MYDYLTENSLNSAIDEQITVLYEMHILKRKILHNDPYEECVKKLLATCSTECQMMNMLHDVKTGDETIEHLLVRKGIL